MKNITTTLLCLISTAAFSQNVKPFSETLFSQFDTQAAAFSNPEPQPANVEIHGNYVRSVTRKTLSTAKTVNDVIANYPESWIKHYTSVEISVSGNGKTLKVSGKNGQLTNEQKTLLKSAELTSKIEIVVNYQSNNSVTNALENNHIKTTLTVIPETEAHYAGDEEALKKFVKTNGINKIPDAVYKDTLLTIVKFTITENGQAANPVIVRASKFPQVDKLLIESVLKMPAWIPAKNASGERVSQDFELRVDNNRGGC